MHVPDPPNEGAGSSPSDTDEARSDADRTSTQRDQVQADADHRASERDQVVSDRDRSLHASTDAKFSQALAAIQGERERATAEREAAALDRTRAAEDRARAAEDRNIAAMDRERAAYDRDQARIGLDKAQVVLENAQLDDLTGFYRLGLGMGVLQREVDRTRRSGGRLVLAFCDVDGLKQVNDERGHAAGNALLTGVADAIRSRLRSYEPVVRVGGDEFVCALTEVDLEQAGRIFDDIQGALAKAKDGASVSVGLASLRPEDDLASLLERSDEALRETRSASV